MAYIVKKWHYLYFDNPFISIFFCTFATFKGCHIQDLENPFNIEWDSAYITSNFINLCKITWPLNLRE